MNIPNTFADKTGSIPLSQLDNNFVAVKSAVDVLESKASTAEQSISTLTTSIQNAIPSGVIVMWSGTTVNIPLGWVLCNGSNGTPNLTDRFIVGVGNTYSPGNTGGSKDAIVVNHTHTASSSVSDPGHSHGVTMGYTDLDSGLFGGGRAPTYATQSTNSATTGISVSTNVNSTGSSGTNANLPPYYALAFIMKV